MAFALRSSANGYFINLQIPKQYANPEKTQARITVTILPLVVFPISTRVRDEKPYCAKRSYPNFLGVAEFEYESRICPHPSPLPREREQEGFGCFGSLLPREKGWG
jgi:hypothetical protein